MTLAVDELDTGYGWYLPKTDAMLNEMPYAPLDPPAHNIAERLVLIGHRAFNADVWGSMTGRAERYWPAFGDYLHYATANPDLPTWWAAFMDGIRGVPLRNIALLHEKNLLCHPTKLPGTQVDDQEVLDAIRTYHADLRDRCRVWVRTRRETNEAAEGTDL